MDKKLYVVKFVKKDGKPSIIQKGGSGRRTRFSAPKTSATRLSTKRKEPP